MQAITFKAISPVSNNNNNLKLPILLENNVWHMDCICCNELNLLIKTFGLSQTVLKRWQKCNTRMQVSKYPK